jgi:tetratricopeptide (TPR) repeat protein/transglutaminase-like putative cysteine protease
MHNMPKLVSWAISLSLLLMTVLISPAFNQTIPTLEKKSATDPSEQAAIIEELNTSARFENDGSSVETVRQRVKIQNEAGIRLYGIITFNFIVGQEFSIDTVEVRKKDGSTVKAGTANIQEITPEISRVAPMYSDIHQKQVTVPGLGVDDEIIFQYTAKQSALVPNQFWFQYSFAKDTIVLSESIQLDIPADRKVHVSFQPEHKPEIKTTSSRTLYQWHASNGKIEEDKKSVTQKESITGTAPSASIQLSTFENWDQVGSWYYSLQHERSVPSAAVRTKALELTKGLGSQEEKIKALYQFVSLNFRYISLDFGIGRYQPHTADEVLANKYGDCKDKHTLLAALLEAVGIASYPALINSTRRIAPDVPSPGQFDHIITAIPMGKNTLFLDTTAEVAPYGLLMAPLRHKKALVITGDSTAAFVETPADLPFTAEEVFDLQGKIDESGTLEADVNYYIHGDAEVLFKSAFRQAPPSKYTELVQGISYFLGFAGEVSQVKIEGQESLNDGIRILYHYHRPAYIDMRDQMPKKSLPLAASHFPRWEENEDSLRLYPSTGQLIHKCKLELPVGVGITAPLEIKLDREYAHYQASYSALKNILTAERKVIILTPEITSTERGGYGAFQKAIYADESQNLMLWLPPGLIAKTASGNTSVNVDELMRQAEIEYRERDYRSARADFRTVAEREPTRKGVWTQIGLVSEKLGDFQDAIDSYQKAITADPFDAQAHTEIAGVYFSVKKSTDGMKELKKALEIDPLNHRAHYLLGWQYSTQMHDPASAVPELEKALSTEDEHFHDEVQVRGMLTDGYFKLKQFDKAVQSLKLAVESAPNPSGWNNAAYMLAENDQDLDLAQQYADSALKGIYERLNQLDSGSIRLPDFIFMAQLAMTWDTMGWIRYKAGHLDLAEKYVRASWILAQNRESAEHLGEIYEKMLNLPEAIRFYAMSVKPGFMGEPSGTDKGRDHLIKLVGRSRSEKVIQARVNEPSLSRTIHLGNIAPAGTKGEFYFIFAPGPKIVAIQLNSGDPRLTETLRKQEGKIAASVTFPEDAPQKLVREGFVMCSGYSKSCDLVFVNSDMPSNRMGLPTGTPQ